MERSAEQDRENVHSLEFGGPIFQIKVDPYRHNLGIEIRHPEARTVDYHLVNLQSGQLIFSSPGQDWWTGLSSVRGNDLLLFHFEDPSLPVHKGIEVRSFPDFARRFFDPHARLLAESEQGVLLLQENGNGLRWESDGIQKEIRSEAVQVEQNKHIYRDHLEKMLQTVKVPEMKVPETAWPEVLSGKSILHQYPPTQSIVSCIEQQDQLIAAWHHAKPDHHYQLHLAYLYKGQVEWSSIIHDNLPLLNPEPFFMVDQFVIWMEERHQIYWIEI